MLREVCVGGGGGGVMPVLTWLDQWAVGAFPSCCYFHGYKIDVLHNQLAFGFCVSVKISGGISPQILNGGRNPRMKPCMVMLRSLKQFIEDILIFGGM